MRLAKAQHGHVHRDQLREAGIGRGAIAHRLGTGLLHETFPSVYRVAGAENTRLGRAMAAALFFRGSAVVCGIDAASIWQLLDTTQQPADTRPIEVLLVGRSYRPRPGLHVHRIRSVARQDVRWRNGIPVTSPALTILGLAAGMDELELEAVLSVAFRKNLVRRAQLEDVLARYPRAKGIAKLRALLTQSQSLRDTRSLYERRLLALLKQAELPLPVTNTWIDDQLVDGLWPELKLVLEFDGWGYHGDRRSFENDRQRDQRLAVAGHRVIRITARQIDRGPYALVARIASIITVLRLGVNSSESRSSAG